MKKTQIIIITIALVLTLGCATFAVVYFATDTFKSEQEMFYKYAGQIDLKEFIDLESYNAYSKRLETEGHANEGAFTIEIAQGEQAISESIKYNGYTDPVNKTANYDISINKDNEILLAMNYLNTQDLYGVQFKDVVNQYIVIENNNLKEFASKMGVQDTSDIPDKIEIPSENINYEELNTILNKYLNIAMEEIPEDNYSKIEKGDISLGDETVEADGYQVNLKVKDVQKILAKVLENAKNDEQLFNLLNSEDMTFEEYQAGIDELLLGLSEEVPSEQNINVITISVYKQGKDTVKLSVAITMDEYVNVEISLENTSKGMMIKFINTETNYDETQDKNIITITKTVNTEEQEIFECVVSQVIDSEETELLNVNISRNGALTSNNVGFSTIASTTMQGISLGIEIQSNTNFSGVPLEGEFVQGNHLVINGLPAEQINNLFTNLGNILGEKLKDEMFVTVIKNLTTYNELVENQSNDIQNALEQESALSNGITPEDLTPDINSTDMEETVTQEETTSEYRPVMPDSTSSQTQNSNEQSTMSQMFSEGQEFLNN